MKRQFIAGATCPSCGAMDTIQRCTEQSAIWMECVACGLLRDLDADLAPTGDDAQPVVMRAPGKRSDG